MCVVRIIFEKLVRIEQKQNKKQKPLLDGYVSNRSNNHPNYFNVIHLDYFVFEIMHTKLKPN